MSEKFQSFLFDYPFFFNVYHNHISKIKKLQDEFFEKYYQIKEQYPYITDYKIFLLIFMYFCPNYSFKSKRKNKIQSKKNLLFLFYTIFDDFHPIFPKYYEVFSILEEDITVETTKLYSNIEKIYNFVEENKNLEKEELIEKIRSFIS